MMDIIHALGATNSWELGLMVEVIHHVYMNVPVAREGF
jgi:hypothetical protein